MRYSWLLPPVGFIVLLLLLTFGPRVIGKPELSRALHDSLVIAGPLLTLVISYFSFVKHMREKLPISDIDSRYADKPPNDKPVAPNLPDVGGTWNATYEWYEADTGETLDASEVIELSHKDESVVTGTITGDGGRHRSALVGRLMGPRFVFHYVSMVPTRPSYGAGVLELDYDDEGKMTGLVISNDVANKMLFTSKYVLTKQR